MTRDTEELSAELHEVYMKEAARQGDVRHAEDYNELPDRIKEFDRALARHIIAREKAILDEIEKPLKMAYDELNTVVNASIPKTYCGQIMPRPTPAMEEIEKAMETINRLRGK